MKTLFFAFLLISGQVMSQDIPLVDESPKLEDIERVIHEHPLVIVVNKAASGPNAQRLLMYENGQEIMNIKVSTGREKEEIAASKRRYFSSTPVGFFRPTQLYFDYYSNTWKTNISNAVFFWPGIALHATTRSHFSALGTRDSGGCVRMLPADSVKVLEKVMSMGRGSKHILDMTESGRTRIDKNFVRVSPISRQTGEVLPGKISSWNVVIVIYEDNGDSAKLQNQENASLQD